ncbi:hypothetical protein ADL35_25115, partial [Streptomyces sp. NRRL WC-3753]
MCGNGYRPRSREDGCGRQVIRCGRLGAGTGCERVTEHARRVGCVDRSRIGCAGLLAGRREERKQPCVHLLGVGRPCLRRLAEQVQDQLLQRFGDLRPQLLQRGG